MLFPHVVPDMALACGFHTWSLYKALHVALLVIRECGPILAPVSSLMNKPSVTRLEVAGQKTHFFFLGEQVTSEKLRLPIWPRWVLAGVLRVPGWGGGCRLPCPQLATGAPLPMGKTDVLSKLPGD